MKRGRERVSFLSFLPDPRLQTPDPFFSVHPPRRASKRLSSAFDLRSPLAEGWRHAPADGVCALEIGCGLCVVGKSGQRALSRRSIENR